MEAGRSGRAGWQEHVEQGRQMTEPVVAQKGPYAVETKAGRKYAWCACGMSKTQPFCDGSHKGSGLEPLIRVAEQSETAYFCGCKHTASKPFCDGSHEKL